MKIFLTIFITVALLLVIPNVSLAAPTATIGIPTTDISVPQGTPVAFSGSGTAVQIPGGCPVSGSASVNSPVGTPIYDLTFGCSGSTPMITLRSKDPSCVGAGQCYLYTTFTPGVTTDNAGYLTYYNWEIGSSFADLVFVHYDGATKKVTVADGASLANAGIPGGWYGPYTMSPGNTIVSYEWREGNCTTGTLLSTASSFSTSTLSLGAHPIYLRVQDSLVTWSTNCPSHIITVTAPDLTAGAVTPVIATAGTALTFSATINNIGTASTGANFSNFFQVATAINGGGTVTDLASSVMTALAMGANAQTTSPSYTLPSAGTYSVHACADKTSSAGGGVIAESDETNNCGAWTTVTVTSANTPPTAAILLPYNGYTTPGSVVFSGTGSDPDVGDTIVAWEWWNGGCGLGMNLSTLSTDTLSFGVGPHTIYFRVKDSKGAWSTCDSRTITITVNIPPVANAGPNQTITLPANSVTMAGSATDSDGTVASHTWSKVSGPVGSVITTPSSYTTTITGLVAGTYTFRLTATDDLGATGSADMTVTVNSAPCTLGGTTVLSGNNITAYQFSLVPAPATCASVSEIRTCNNGAFTAGSYMNDTCSVVTSCTLPWGGTIPSGGSVTAYQVSSSLNCASVSQTRTCSSGTLSGSFTKQSCTATKLKYQQF